jgi:hypothetical protein
MERMSLAHKGEANLAKSAPTRRAVRGNLYNFRRDAMSRRAAVCQSAKATGARAERLAACPVVPYAQ